MEEKNDNILFSFIFLFFTEMLMVHLPTPFYLKGCILDSVLHVIYLISLLSFIFNFIIMESLSDIEYGFVVPQLNFYHIFYWDFSF